MQQRWSAAMMLACLCFFLLATAPPSVAAPAPHPAARAVSVILLSDIHFDPFHDPSKFAALRAAPVSQWPALLNTPDAANQPEAFASLQNACKAKGVDTDWQLLVSSLKAAAVHGAPLFVTVSGDLMAHNFKCRFKALAPSATDEDYTDFAEKTVALVTLELHRAFSATPVYVALGNNDSGCGDYQATPHDAFLRKVAGAVAADVPPLNSASVIEQFAGEGDYSVPLPAPMQQTQLIVLQDLFQSSRYETCSGTPDPAAAAEQVTWLSQQLAQARSAQRQVWIMAHIPPGVDAYSSFHHKNNVCTGDAPVSFLRTDAMAHTLEQYGDVIRLVILAHTHNDEMRLLPAEDGSAIPAKLVPSISPVHGNNPAFLVASVNPRTATLLDYSEYAASNQTGEATEWPLEYQYSTTYGLPDFSGASLRQLIAGFTADAATPGAKARDYQRYYSAGEPDKKQGALPRIWPGYICSMTVQSSEAFRSCVCEANAATP